MSQPDMFPEEAPREEPPRRALHHQHEDLRALPFPLGDWGEPAERLEELYRWAEEGALRTAEWYLRDRVAKRRGARALRVAAAVSAAAGVVLPVLDLTGAARATASWGCLCLLLAAVCVALDRVLGLTSGWMRDMAAAQAVHRRLEALRFDWAAESVREVLGPTEGTAAEAAERCLAVLRRFCDDVAELVRTETADWMLDFGGRGVGAAMRTQSAGGWAGGWTGREVGPFLRLPQVGVRPTMPRQRPPEAPL